MFKEQVLTLRKSLQKHAKPETKVWWENYVKNSAPFMGVKMPVIRTVLHRWHKENVEGKIEYPEQLDLSLALFDGKYTEEKLAGTLFLQEILIPSRAIKCSRDIDRFAALFAGGRIYDWNICDWFCVKVLGPLIEESGLACANRISMWRTAENLWQARASLVAFVTVADNSIYYPAIQTSCQILITRKERFAKTAVGWILRDISKHNESFVQHFIDENIKTFSTESLKNAIKYFSKDIKNQYVKILKELDNKSVQ